MTELPDMERLSERYIDDGETFLVTPISRWWCMSRGTLTTPAAMREYDQGDPSEARWEDWKGEPGEWPEDQRGYLWRQHGAMDLTLTLIEHSLLSSPGHTILLHRSGEEETDRDWTMWAKPDPEDLPIEVLI